MTDFFYVYDSKTAKRPTKRSTVDNMLNPVQQLTIPVGANRQYTSIDDVLQNYMYYKDPVTIIVDENHIETKPIFLSGGDFSNFTIKSAGTTFNSSKIFVDDSAIFNFLNNTSDDRYTDAIILASDYNSRFPYFTLSDSVGPKILAQFERVSPFTNTSIGLLLAFGSKITIGDITNGVKTENSGFSNFGKNNILAMLGSSVILGENAYILGAGIGNTSPFPLVDEIGGGGNNIALLHGSSLSAGWFTGAGTYVSDAISAGVTLFGSTASYGPSIFFNSNAVNDTVANNGSIVQADNTFLGTSVIDASSALFASASANISNTTNSGFGTPTI